MLYTYTHLGACLPAWMPGTSNFSYLYWMKWNDNIEKNARSREKKIRLKPITSLHIIIIIKFTYSPYIVHTNIIFYVYWDWFCLFFFLSWSFDVAHSISLWRFNWYGYCMIRAIRISASSSNYRQAVCCCCLYIILSTGCDLALLLPFSCIVAFSPHCSVSLLSCRSEC